MTTLDNPDHWLMGLINERNEAIAERDRYKGALERIRDAGCDLEKAIGSKCAPMYPCRGCLAAEALAAQPPKVGTL